MRWIDIPLLTGKFLMNSYIIDQKAIVTQLNNQIDLFHYFG